MKFLVLDTDGEGMGVDISIRAQDAGHDVKYWLPPHKTGVRLHYGDGFLDKPKGDFEPLMDWADLIMLIGNSQYVHRLLPYFAKGYPIFGTNPRAAKLELDRGAGQKVLEEHGIQVAPYKVVNSVDEALELVQKTGMAFAIKPWGGEADKALTYVAKTADDAIFTLERWKKMKLAKGQFMMQEKIKGIEVGIGGMFGPGGWCGAIEESFEHKKFLNDDLGENTGEMGTVLRHVAKSKLFDRILDPITDYLHSINFVGDCSVNCIVTPRGTPLPLEFTLRVGWPNFCIRQAVLLTDPVQWMADLLRGKDSFRVSPAIACGIVMAHGDFPQSKDIYGTWDGFPIYGVEDSMYPALHYQQMMEGKAPMLINGKVKEMIMPLTAGNYVMVVTGTGGTVREATKRAYAVVDRLDWPSNVMYRTDIGKRLEKELPELQRHGYCLGMKYGS